MGAPVNEEKSAWRRTSAQQSLEASVIKQCPITGGLPTRMTRSTFERMCNGQRDGLKKQGNFAGKRSRKTWCEVCRGKQIPAEVEFIEVELIKMEGSMGKEICEQCGAKVEKLYSSSGKKTCSSCQKLRQYVKARPEVAEAVLGKVQGTGEEKPRYDERDALNARSIRKALELPASWPVTRVLDIVGGLLTSLEIMAAQKEEALAHELGIVKGDLLDARELLKGAAEFNEEKSAEIEALMAALDMPADTTLTDVLKEVAELDEVLERYRKTIEKQAAEIARLDQELFDQARLVIQLREQIDFPADNLSSGERQAFDLALAVIRGDGDVLADQLELMRGAA